MRVRRVIAALAAVCALWLVTAVAVPRADDSPLVVAMQDELTRSMSDLRLQNEPRPYYIAYEVDEMIDTSLTGRLGAIVADTSRRVRVLDVDVRVGDYTFDSSRFVSGRGGAPPAAGNIRAPLDDNYDVMRRQIWLATDTAYKRAVTIYARKKAAFQDRSATDLLPDFSKETPVETVVPAQADAPAGDWTDRIKQISNAFRSSPELQNSDVSAGETRGTRYYVNSEGFKVVTPIHAASLRVSADTQAADGTAIRDSFGLVERRLQDLPPAADIAAEALALAARLTAERTAPIGEEYTGPVLVDGQASGELLAQSLVPLMLARRPPDVETNGRGGGPQNQQVTPFLTRIGLRVLPDAFSASDTPSLSVYAGKPVPGSYTVDDEGVPAKDVSLVENGKLITLLTSRTPQRKLLQSNGHGRSGTVQPGVFQMQSSQAVPAAQLKEKYLAVLKDQDKTFGYIVRGIGGQGASPVIQHVVRVALDGSETPVRGLRFATIASTAFRNILEASVERPMYSYVSGSGDMVSVIVPSLIFEELEIQQTKDVAQKPPIVPSPLGN
jgi:predicted Zn-dependent protease